METVLRFDLSLPWASVWRERPLPVNCLFTEMGRVGDESQAAEKKSIEAIKVDFYFVQTNAENNLPRWRRRRSFNPFALIRRVLIDDQGGNRGQMTDLRNEIRVLHHAGKTQHTGLTSLIFDPGGVSQLLPPHLAWWMTQWGIDRSEGKQYHSLPDVKSVTATTARSHTAFPNTLAL